MFHNKRSSHTDTDNSDSNYKQCLFLLLKRRRKKNSVKGTKRFHNEKNKHKKHASAKMSFPILFVFSAFFFYLFIFCVGPLLSPTQPQIVAFLIAQHPKHAQAECRYCSTICWPSGAYWKHEGNRCFRRSLSTKQIKRKKKKNIHYFARKQTKHNHH